MRIILLMCFFTVYMGIAQIPIVETYTVKDHNYSPRSWNVTKGGNGLMYFANSDGLLEYDGIEWRLIEVPDSYIRELATDSEGNVFVSGITNFGFLEEDALGRTHYVSLSDSLSDKEKSETIWGIQCIQDTAYFYSDKNIFICNSNGVIKVVDFEYVNRVFKVRNNYYVHTIDNILKLSGKKDFSFDTIVFNDHLKEYNIKYILPYKDDDLLILTYDNAYTVNADGIVSEFTLRENTQQWIKNNEIYSAKVLNSTIIDDENELYILIGKLGGAIILNSRGEIMYKLNKENGLESENLYRSFYDNHQGILWLVGPSNIQKLYFDFPITKFNNKYVDSRVHRICNIESTTYLATDNGLLYKMKHSSKFKKVANTYSQCWNLLKIQDELYVSGGNAGLYIVKNNEVVNDMSTSHSLFDIMPINTAKTLFLGATYTGIILFEKIKNGFQIIGKVPDTEGIDVRSLKKDKYGNYWCGTSLNGFMRITINNELQDVKNSTMLLEMFKVVYYNKENGLILDEDCKITETEKGLLFSSKNGIYKFNYKQDEFEVHNPFNLSLSTSTYNNITLSEDKNGNLWIVEPKIIINKESDDSFTIDDSTLNIIPYSASCMFHDNENRTWIGTNDDLYVYNQSIIRKDYHFTAVINHINIGDNLFQLKGIFTDKTIVNPIEFSSNSILFSFTSNSYIYEKEIMFRYKLIGADKQWSDWSINKFKDYNDLHEGKYEFLVQAKDIFGKKSEIGSVHFTINPPWYREMWAYVSYTVIFFLMILLIIRLSVLRLKRAKVKLESIVKERTKEIAFKNKEITDSINYAKRIQKAILQPEEKVSDFIPEHFVLFKPKDIVSGDFYFSYLKKYNNKKYWYVIVGDCTGHGVPGAFLTMLGISHLNEIVSRSKLIEPDYILDSLRNKIINNLGQNREHNRNRDGMDMSVVRIDLDTLQVSYAGANNSLWIIKRKEQSENLEQNLDGNIKTIANDTFSLIEIKADKQPVSYQENSTSFTTHTFQLEKGDLIYQFSDGYADQFGGVDLKSNNHTGKKFKSIKFKKLLLEINQKTLQEQKKILEKSFEDWKGDLDQVDDVCVIGVRL